MRWSRPAPLGKSIEAIASNRPIKVAYLVPVDEARETHLILDAVFYESYTRWGGAYTLVIPVSSDGFHAAEYRHWLSHYDPDFVMSYVDLPGDLVADLDSLCCPIALLGHEAGPLEDNERDWRSFLPRWEHYFKSIPSISTVLSPASYPQLHHEERPHEPTILTQYGSRPADRFLADNFGAGFDPYTASNAVSGLYTTLCLVPPDLPPNHLAGTTRCTSPLDAFKAISERKATPIARLAMVHSESIPRPEAIQWTSAFRIFIGDSVIDRINFWNCRHLGDNWAPSFNSLIIGRSILESGGFAELLGDFLNKNNFLGGSGGGPYRVALHSCSVEGRALSDLKDRLQTRTWNSVQVPASFNALAVPTQHDIEHRSYRRTEDTTTLRLSEDFTSVTATSPAHLSYLPPQRRGLGRGQWMVDLTIERHNNLSRYSNVLDTWTLPRRIKVAKAFTDRLAKPTSNGALALLPSSDVHLASNTLGVEPRFYEVKLPSDEAFFRYLALSFFRRGQTDLRATCPSSGYSDLSISDKGENLRGVIAMFDNLSTSYEVMTNAYWRKVIDSASEESKRPRTFDMNKLRSFLPGDRASIDRLTREYHFSSSGVTKSYLRDSLLDTLERLVRANVFLQVALWRCEYCGHANARTFDSMKIKNSCDICSTEYWTPIDVEWKYEMNEFVYRSLHRHSGLPVLWTLGYLQDRLHAGSFWYLPEVDLYESENGKGKKEIDILCMVDRKFYAIEVKRSVTLFLNAPDAIDKFCNVVTRLRPDVAGLSFQRYCAQTEDEADTRERLRAAEADVQKRIGPWTKLEILVAEDEPSFNHFSADLGWVGSRVSRYS